MQYNRYNICLEAFERKSPQDFQTITLLPFRTFWVRLVAIKLVSLG